MKEKQRHVFIAWITLFSFVALVFALLGTRMILIVGAVNYNYMSAEDRVQLKSCLSSERVNFVCEKDGVTYTLTLPNGAKPFTDDSYPISWHFPQYVAVNYQFDEFFDNAQHLDGYTFGLGDDLTPIYLTSENITFIIHTHWLQFPYGAFNARFCVLSIDYQ